MKPKYTPFYLPVLTAFFFLNQVNAQRDLRFNFGANVGLKSKTGDGGFMIGLDWKNRVNIYSGILNVNVFQGIGFSAGSEVFLTNFKFRPVLGITYCYFGDNRFYTGKEGENKTNYYVGFANGLVFHAGVRYLLYPDEPSLKGALSFQPYISYRNWFTSVKSEHLEGELDKKKFQIDRRIGEGFGAGISVIYLFGKNRI